MNVGRWVSGGGCWEVGCGEVSVCGCGKVGVSGKVGLGVGS